MICVSGGGQGRRGDLAQQHDILHGRRQTKSMLMQI